ncbi:hypothetical protein ACLOJK_033649 [Asimina triloba]
MRASDAEYRKRRSPLSQDRIHHVTAFDARQNMRSNWANQPFLSPRHGLPFSISLLCAISVLALIAVFRSPPSKSFDSAISSSTFNAYRSYRRLREDAVNDFLEIRSLSLGIARKGEHDLCGKDRENYVPCYNVSANQLAGFHHGKEFDRHCEVAATGPRCLVRPPKDYKIPIRWPAGRDVIWSGNLKITKDQFLSSGTMTKRLMILEEGQIAFRSDDDGPHDDNGVKHYSRQIAEMIGLNNDSEFLQAGVRNVLDIGCGFGSFGAHLFSLNLMTICIAAYEIFGSQVQIALERGLPAMIGNFISRQLPYPSLSFDMVHCAQCGIIWDQNGTSELLFLIHKSSDENCY